MIPSRQSQIPMMFGRGRTGARFGSSAALTFRQLPNMDGQLPPLPLLDVAQNPAEINIGRIRDDEFIDVKSSCNNHEEGGGSNDCHKKRDRPRGRKRYHRHTQHQIQELQAFFNKCPHPDDKKRKQLSLELGLDPLQIKFWFQNRRTQMKTKHGRQETTQLRAENERLWAENKKCKDALSNTPCLSCIGLTALGEMSFEEYHLRMENEKLREKNNRIAALAAKQVARPMLKHSVVSPPIPSRLLEHQFFVGKLGAVGEPYGIAELVMSYSGLSDQVHKQLIVELAVAVMDELTRMAHIDEPIPERDMCTPCVLNHEEYMRTFLKVNGPRPPAFKSEASLETAIVMMNHTDLVEILMNVNRWARVFSSIVARAITLEVFSGVGGSYNGALQVMAAEFQVLSPIVPTRETHFVRYCKHHADGTWAVVDVSLEGLRPSSVVRFRRTSGCLIQDLSHGYSKVTWVEHVEVDDRGVHHLYRPLVNSGLAFGAKRWLSILDRQCDRLATAMATKLPPGEFTNTGMRSMLKLAERMVISFFGGVSASTAHMWTTLCGSGADDIRIMTHRSTDDPGRPHGITISAATSFWLPVPPKRVFDYLFDVLNRNEWDILSSGGVIEKVVHIAHGRETGNAVSLLRIAGGNLNNMLLLQESCADPTGSFIIYAPVDSVSMHIVFGGGDSDYVALLPSGFAILPDGPTGHGGGNDEPGSGGSLLTAAFQILVNSAPDAMPTLGSVVAIRDLVDCTVRRIKAAMGTEGP